MNTKEDSRGGFKTIKVSHFKYWWLPIMNAFTLDGLTHRCFYRQKKTTYLASDGKVVIYELEVWQR